jgi:hypothetical protein
MGEQWFLDLDGVRSGPYDDEEIVALLKEGELLPHHKISYSIDEPEWQTMIEWRLKKAFRDAAIQSSNTTSIPRARTVEIRDTNPQSPRPPETKEPPPTFEENITSPSITPIPPPSSPLDEIEEEAEEIAHTFIARIPREVVEAEPETEDGLPRKSRDAAVGQLLDLYQNIRGKRQETKQALENSVASIGNSPKEPKSSLLRPLLLVLSLGALGYGVGRLWNGSETEADLAVNEPVASATPAPTPEQSEPRTVERKTEKFTIRAVTNQPKFIVPDPPPPKPTPKVDFTAEQLNELKQLRNEVEELRALQGNSAPPQNPQINPPVDNGSLLDPRLVDPGQGGMQNGAPPADPGQELQ